MEWANQTIIYPQVRNSLLTKGLEMGNARITEGSYVKNNKVIRLKDGLSKSKWTIQVLYSVDKMWSVNILTD